MSDNELLLAISEMLDKKLDEKLEPIKQEISNLATRMDALEKRMENLETRMENLENRVDVLETRMSTLEMGMNDLNRRLKQLEVLYEAQVMPRLNTIESCYASTFERYQQSLLENENMKQDVETNKIVLETHSEKLKKFHKLSMEQSLIELLRDVLS